MSKKSTKQWINLPLGRLLYRLSDIETFVVIKSRQKQEYWITSDGWNTNSKSAGPFRPTDILRAYRLANTLIPDGCELLQWQDGLNLFPTAKLPGHADDWTRIEPTWLPVTLSHYTAADVRDIPNRACCAPPTNKPQLTWLSPRESNSFKNHLKLIQNQHPNHEPYTIATLTKSWNAHPPGSPLLTENIKSDKTFIIIDI